MRETRFIQQNKEKWQEFEQILRSSKKDPDKLSSLFVQITDDLSYSRTYYPNRSVRVYLNSLAQQIFYSIYKNRRFKISGFAHFWKEELPQLIWNARKEFMISFGIFFMAFMIGVISTHYDNEFPRVILGSAYVDQTIQNIENGDPMAVYKQSDELSMALGITVNNLFVAFKTFIFGIFFAIGTIFIMIYNGVMVGSFQYFFYTHGALKESLLTIWIHGTLEISAIIIAGAAGLTMGRGLVFPGTFSRVRAFQSSAYRGIKIMLGITPVIIFAGLIEGFVTRYTDAPDFMRIALILASLTFILSYFVWYPYKKAKAGFASPVNEPKLPVDENRMVRFNRVKTAGEIFTDTFLIYRKYFKKLLRFAAAGAGVYTLALLGIHQTNMSDMFAFKMWGGIGDVGIHFENILQYYDYSRAPWLYPLNVMLFTLVCFFGAFYFHEVMKKETYEVFTLKTLRGFFRKHFLNISLIALFYNAVFFAETGWAVLLSFTLLPFAMLWMKVVVMEDVNIFAGLGRMFSLANGHWGQMIGIYIVFFGLSGIFTFLIDTSFFWFFYEIVSWSVSLNEANTSILLTSLLTFMTMFVFGLIFPLFLTGMGLLYASLREIRDATSLKERIHLIGVKKHVYGLEREN